MAKSLTLALFLLANAAAASQIVIAGRVISLSPDNLSQHEFQLSSEMLGNELYVDISAPMSSHDRQLAHYSVGFRGGDYSVQVKPAAEQTRHPIQVGLTPCSLAGSQVTITYTADGEKPVFFLIEFYEFQEFLDLPEGDVGCESP